MALRPPGGPESDVRMKVRSAIDAGMICINNARAAAVDLKGASRFRGQHQVRSRLLGAAHRMELEVARLNKELRALAGELRTPPDVPPASS